MAKEEKNAKQLLTEKEFKVKEQNMRAQEESWRREKDLLERQYKIQEEKRSLKRPKLFSMSTTKLIVLFLFINCTIIEIFTGWATYESLKISEIMGTYADFSPLVALIGAVVGEVMGFAVYAAKAKAENTAGGLVFEQAMQNMQPTTQTAENNDDDEIAMG